MQDAVNDSEQTLKADTTPYEITAITHGSLVQHLTKQKSWSERNMEDEVRDISSDVTVNNPSMLKDTYCDISKHEDSMSENVPAPNNRRAQMRLKNHQKNVDRARNKASCLVLTIVVIFLIQWSPFWIFQIFVIFTEHEIAHIHLINMIIGTLTYSNTISNPIIYMLTTFNFKMYCQKSFFKSVTSIFRRKITSI